MSIRKDVLLKNRICHEILAYFDTDTAWYMTAEFIRLQFLAS